nr:hypothetical protein [Candidatus Cloacimonadota bacterium]
MKEAIHERSWVEIDLAVFRHNLNVLKGYLLAGQSFMQIVKADAYGHGAKEISEAALASGAVYLGVANAEEGRVLRLQSCKAPILILSPALISEIPKILEYDLSPSISDLSFASALSTEARKSNKEITIHLKIDTGMHRSGVDVSRARTFYDAVAKLPNLKIEGIFSHFASAENDSQFTKRQEKLFQDLISSLEQPPRYVHISNSAGLIGGYGKFCNLVRLGIASFGIRQDGNKDIPLKPVMSFKSSLIQIKDIRAGESVGYQREWFAKKDGRYGIIPVGYADGYDFLLSNKSVVLIRDRICPVIGRISMDMLTVDLSHLDEASLGDEVILLGDENENLRVENISSIYHGSAYELLCQVGRRAKRFYRIEDHILHSTPLARRDFVAKDFDNSKLNHIISAALAERLDDQEIGEMIYREILRNFFYNKDRDIHYRKDFHHEISFAKSDSEDFYLASTHLSYKKVLSSDFFIIACASSNESLRTFLMDPRVEYRWLLDAKLSLHPHNFIVNAVRVNGLDLHTTLEQDSGSLLIRCSHPKLRSLINSELDFEINTTTLYPKSSHQFSVFISELTQGVQISFEFPEDLSHVEPVSIFSGQEKNPPITFEDHRISIKTKPDEWIFPLSGVVFAY